MQQKHREDLRLAARDGVLVEQARDDLDAKLDAALPNTTRNCKIGNKSSRRELTNESQHPLRLTEEMEKSTVAK